MSASDSYLFCLWGLDSPSRGHSPHHLGATLYWGLRTLCRVTAACTPLLASVPSGRCSLESRPGRETQTMSRATQAQHSHLQPRPSLLCHCPVLPSHPGPVEDTTQTCRSEGNSPALRWPKIGWSTLRNGRSPSLDGWEPGLNSLGAVGGLQWE